MSTHRNEPKRKRRGSALSMPEPNYRRFVDQIAIVVGGAQGIGKAIAVRLASEGARVLIADIDREEMTRTSREIEALHGIVLTAQCDVRKPSSRSRGRKSPSCLVSN